MSFEAKLYSQEGNLLRSAKNGSKSNQIIFDVGDLSDGTCFLHIISDKKVIKKQIIIKH